MKISQHFTKENPRGVTTLKDDAPQWLLDAVRDAHQGDMPCDWIFEECYAAACAIDDESLRSDDDLHSHADGQVDIYTKEIYQWAADMCLSSTFSYAEERLEEMGLGGDRTTALDLIQGQQFCAIEYIASVILNAWVAACEEESEDA